MAKGVYVFLMFLLLTASVSMAQEWCKNLSGGFKGMCLTHASCNDVCVNVDHQNWGQCDMGPSLSSCYCYHPYPKWIANYMELECLEMQSDRSDKEKGESEENEEKMSDMEGWRDL
ncbi:hypothetical protein SUGI_0909300 [Cryptomeria japonica]|nr:hypothetical protein SUGI_0909300 [Cryptomeria japonica]